MARVTIEDSMAVINTIPEWGQFHMILLAAGRAHQLQRGATPKIPNNRGDLGLPDAPTVLALREIAAGYVDFTDVIIPKKDHFGQIIEEEEKTEDVVEDK